jgi:hypothetical protein
MKMRFRTATFDRKLEDLRAIGGFASVAAGKADQLICLITNEKGDKLREKFGLTRHGEHRIRRCQKYNLGCGCRLVFIRKGCHIVLLYIGSHDDCSRWLERNSRMVYELDGASNSSEISTHSCMEDSSVPGDEIAEECRTYEYEEQLMRRIDDRTLRKIFSGLTRIRATNRA